MSSAATPELGSPSERFRRHASAALVAGLATMAVIGVANGAALWKGAESWFASIDGTASVRARAELFRQAPTLFWAVVYDGGIGALLGGLWGVGVGAWASRRAKPHPARGGLASWHLSAFLWFPFLLIVGLAAAMKRQELHPIASAVLARRLVVNVPLTLLFAWLGHRATWAVFRWLGARAVSVAGERPRPGATRRGVRRLGGGGVVRAAGDRARGAAARGERAARRHA